MIIESAPKDAPWSFVARTVFWSRDVDLDSWRAGVLRGHPSYLPDSVRRMSAWNFIRFLGRKTFVEHWPQMRKNLDLKSADVAKFDAFWSFAKTGVFDMPPESVFAHLPGRRAQVLDAIVRNQGASIYEVAKISKTPYRRAHDHVSSLIEQGLVRASLDEAGPRRKKRLFTLR
jgi:hypothetical protein